MLYIPTLNSIHTVITNSQRDNLIISCIGGAVQCWQYSCYALALHLCTSPAPTWEAWPLVSTWVVRSARCLTRWQDGEGDCLQVRSWSVRDWLWALPNPCSGTPGVLTSSNTGETCLSETSHRPTCPIVLWTSPQKKTSHECGVRCFRDILLIKKKSEIASHQIHVDISHKDTTGSLQKLLSFRY